MSAEPKHQSEPMRVVRPVAGDLALSRLAQLFLEEQRIRSSRHHVKTLRGYFDTVQGMVGDLASSEFDEPLMLSYRSARIDRGLAVTTVNKEVAALERALRWAKKAGHITRNNLAGIEPLKVRNRDVKKRRRALTDAELKRFMEAAREDDVKAAAAGKRKVPQAALFLLLLRTGGRRGEVLSVRWRHLELDYDLPSGLSNEEREMCKGSGRVTFVDTKNDLHRTAPLGPEVVKELQALRLIHAEVLGRPPRADEHVFLSPMGKPLSGCSSGNTLRAFNRILNKAGISKNVDGLTVDVHACRMTASTTLQRAGAKLASVQKILGHSTPELTASTYTDFGEAENFAALSQLIGELRRNGASAEDIEEALLAFSSGSHLSAVASLETELKVNGGERQRSTDCQLPKLNVDGSSPFSRSI